VAALEDAVVDGAHDDPNVPEPVARVEEELQRLRLQQPSPRRQPLRSVRGGHLGPPHVVHTSGRLIHALWDIRAAGARGLAHLGLHQPVKRAHPHHHLPHGRHAEPQPELSRVFPAALPGLKRVGPGGEYHPRRGVGHALPAQQRAPPAAREVAAVGAGRRSRRRVRRELGLGIGARRAAAGPERGAAREAVLSRWAGRGGARETGVAGTVVPRSAVRAARRSAFPLERDVSS